MERILAVARASFAQRGSAGTSMRAVAHEADVDPRLVAYYFGDKAKLLEACLTPPAEYLASVEQVVHGPLRGRGEAMARNMMRSWETPDTAYVLRAIMLTAVHEPVALNRLRAILRHNMVAAVADALDDSQRYLRANLAASQIIGLCLTRYVYELEPVASLPADDVARLVGPKIQQYLSGPLPDISALTAPSRESDSPAPKRKKAPARAAPVRAVRKR